MDNAVIWLFLFLNLRKVYGDEDVVVGNTAKLPCKSQLQGNYGMVVWHDPSMTLLSRNEDMVTHDARFSVENYVHEWNLFIDGVHTGDGGTYTCTINSDPVQQYEVMLNIMYPPSSINKSDDESVVTGSNVTMTCEADGAPEPTITWSYVHPNGEKQLLREDSEAYTVYDAGQKDAGLYECVADNGVNPSASATIKLDVKFSPVLVLPHPQISQSEGKDTLLDCLVSANPLLQHMWVKNGEEIVDSERFTVRSWQVDAYTKRLDVFITGIVQEDFGAYTCVAANQYGETNATMQLYELHTGTVRVTSTPDDVITRLGSDARFNCTVEGMSNRDNLIWWHRHAETNTYVKLYESNPSSQAHSRSRAEQRDKNIYSDNIEVIGYYDILVKDVTMQDSGLYICELVALQNYTAELTVVDKLVCGGNLTGVTEGERMNLTCSMPYNGAHTSWDVTWTHDDVKLSSIDYDQPGLLQRSVSFRTWETDSGKYTCTVHEQNHMTPQSCDAYLTVLGEVTAAPVGEEEEEEEPEVLAAQLPMLSVILGIGFVVMFLLFIFILLGTVKYYRTQIHKLRRPPPRVVSARYKNGSVSVEQERPLTQRLDSNPEAEEV